MKMVNIQYHVVYHNTMVLTSGINISLTTFLCCVCVVIILELHFIVTFKKLKCHCIRNTACFKQVSLEQLLLVRQTDSPASK